ncbi:glycosyltransferase [Vibrio cionasavignyae]|uniref:glycosyltransferase n=1 Tax=Vibrio cionasavignyae TaxID=2910252 RepID=UPI003D11F0BF
MRDLIVFGEDFGALPSSTQHLVKRLAKQRKVLWINSIGLRQPRFSRHDLHRAANKLLGKDKSHQLDLDTETVPNSITIVNLITIPAPRSMVARKLAANLMAYQLRPIINKLSLNNALVWTSLPTAVDVCPLLGDYPVVYYCGDDFGALAGVDHRTVLEHEERLVATANMIITASDKLLSKFPGSKTNVLSHGVDCGKFSTPAIRATDLPNNNRPIAGFYGSLSDWLDYPLLNDAIRALPHWDFVFIGQLELDSFPIIQADNVHYLGPRPHSQLPSYSQHWTVSLLPFVLNEQIIACNPLKLKEYLASRRPIVTSNFPALEPYREHVNVVHDSASLIEALKRLELHSAELPKGIVDSESWDQRVITLERYLEVI